MICRPCVLQLHETRSFGSAGRTPGCPEVEQNYLASIHGKIELPTIQIGEREFRCERMSSRCVPERRLSRFLPTQPCEIGAERQSDSQDQNDSPFHRLLLVSISVPRNRTAPLSLGYRITFFHPVRAEIVRNVKDLHVLEAHGAEFLVGGIDLWTRTPGTTSTIEQDRPTALKGLHTFAQLLDGLRTGGGADVLGPRNVFPQCHELLAVSFSDESCRGTTAVPYPFLPTLLLSSCGLLLSESAAH